MILQSLYTHTQTHTRRRQKSLCPPAPPFLPPPSQPPHHPAAAAEATPGLRGCRCAHFLAGVPKEAAPLSLQGVALARTPAEAQRPLGQLTPSVKKREELQTSPSKLWTPADFDLLKSARPNSLTQEVTGSNPAWLSPSGSAGKLGLGPPGGVEPPAAPEAPLPHPLLPTGIKEPLPMDLQALPTSREQGWYLKLMAPNIKGPSYAWLDPSRLYCNPQALQDCVEDLVRPFRDDAIDHVVGIDAMGFILGSAIAVTLGKGFVTIRKAGHLCVETRTQTYKDYTNREKVMEIRTDAIGPGDRVLLVDQWVETGGTMQGAIQLVEQQGSVVAGIAAICIEDSDGGRWLKSHYKWSHCVAPHLMPQFNAQQLDSFQAFRTSLPSQEQPQRHQNHV
ncbi:uncharacterized protein [Erythrolamprus reginae]|uniref:uncharacterized protein n=1 Tax=Erythrolamprus reginae TaxID=121349 RepID=UPI00396CC1C5